MKIDFIKNYKSLFVQYYTRAENISNLAPKMEENRSVATVIDCLSLSPLTQNMNNLEEHHLNSLILFMALLHLGLICHYIPL